MILGGVMLLAANLYVQSPTVQQRIRQALTATLHMPVTIRKITLSPWEGLRIDEDDVAAGTRQQLCRGAAGRAGADDQDVAALGQGGDVEIHAVVAGRGAPMRRAAMTAQAVIAPTSAKVS